MGNNIKPNDMPTFTTWSMEDLSRFAAELYVQLIEQKEANEQLRLDNKDLIKLLRKDLLS